MAKLDIAQKRLPQDGRISLRMMGHEVDIRVSTLPSSNGERVVLRLLDKRAVKLDLSYLGFSKSDFETVSNIISRPHGIVLVTGPTGSGKTTTLYAALSKLNNQSRNIMTIEDPIEYHLEGVGQTQVNNKIEFSFAQGLRAILRQDPDIVMVGEIRDVETAKIAVQASLTGHLVLSTLHTNSAVGAVARLHDMGVEPFLLSSSLIGLMAQRLVRQLCATCKESYIATPGERQFLKIPANAPQTTLCRATGCEECNNIGYRGRLGIYECIAIDEKMRELIYSNASEQELRAYANRNANTIQEDGFMKILQGLTTIEEVIRVTRE
jgi:general secretion pathway protein E